MFQDDPVKEHHEFDGYRGELWDDQEILLNSVMNGDSAEFESEADEGFKDSLISEGEGSDEAEYDSVEMYMRIISRTPLLTPQEEVELSKRVREGDMEARRKMVEANLRLVIHIAKQFASQTSLPLADMIQEGSLGLVRAVDKFDWRRGYRFTTYAAWWIRQAIKRAIAEQSRSIKLPIKVASLIGKISAVTHKLTQKLGRQPTIEEIAETSKLPLKKLKELMYLIPQPLSLDVQVSAEDGTTLGELVRDDAVLSPEDAACQAAMKEHLRKLLSTLTERERDILSLRYGFVDGKERSLSEVSSILKVTREAVRQAEQKIFRKIRNSLLSKHLRDYLEVS
ncbi:MAG: sigma-70 family RNA polymerase sigma factor [Armatimonadota bacterium]|nr:sigma-70 family RNA polymerase sigma factor [Armatimonadota bacterium]MDW8025380.1 sigma-70 family RNA polymerase sigma factor [Armatimonadota bacterium]